MIRTARPLEQSGRGRRAWQHRLRKRVFSVSLRQSASGQARGVSGVWSLSRRALADPVQQLVPRPALMPGSAGSRARRGFFGNEPSPIGKGIVRPWAIRPALRRMSSRRFSPPCAHKLIATDCRSPAEPVHCPLQAASTRASTDRSTGRGGAQLPIDTSQSPSSASAISSTSPRLSASLPDGGPAT